MRDYYGDLIFTKVPKTALHNHGEVSIQQILCKHLPEMQAQVDQHKAQQQPKRQLNIDALQRKFRR
jgi:hypothetical protein